MVKKPSLLVTDCSLSNQDLVKGNLSLRLLSLDVHIFFSILLFGTMST